MVRAFDRLPAKLARVFAGYLITGRRRETDLMIPVHLLRQLSGVGIPPDPHGQTVQFPPAVVGADLTAATRALVERLVLTWSERNAVDAFGAEATGDDGKERAATAWQDIAEQFVAVQAVIFLAPLFTQMRYLALMAAAAVGALLVAATEYPFQPEKLIMYATVGLVAAVLAVIVWVLYRINKSEIVSRVTRTTPGQFSLTSGFVVNFVQLALPLVFVAAAQMSGWLRTIVEPFLAVLK